MWFTFEVDSSSLSFSLLLLQRLTLHSCAISFTLLVYASDIELNEYSVHKYGHFITGASIYVIHFVVCVAETLISMADNGNNGVNLVLIAFWIIEWHHLKRYPLRVRFELDDQIMCSGPMIQNNENSIKMITLIKNGKIKFARGWWSYIHSWMNHWWKGRWWFQWMKWISETNVRLKKTGFWIVPWNNTSSKSKLKFNYRWLADVKWATQSISNRKRAESLSKCPYSINALM